jgi:hypothetical protein
MGKPRFSDLSEEEQLEVRRQVTRELNEAAQNARDAGRGLAAARDLITRTSAETVANIVDTHMIAVNDHVKKASDDLRAQILREEQKTRDHYGQLLGATSFTDLITYLVSMVIESLLPEVNRALGTLPGATGQTRIHISGIRQVNEPEVLVSVIDDATYRQKLKDGTAVDLGLIIDGINPIGGR